MLVTLATIRGQVRDLGNYENSTRFTNPFVNDQINKALGELYELLSGVHQGYFDTEGALVTVAGVATVDLPADFWRLRGADVQLGGRYHELRQIGIAERNRYQASAQPRAFRIAAGGVRGQFVIYPTPDQVYTLRIIYEPSSALLVSDSDTVEDFNGWSDYLIAAALLRLDTRERRPLDDRLAQLERAKQRVISAAGERRATEPEYLINRTHSGGADLWNGGEP